MSVCNSVFYSFLIWQLMYTLLAACNHKTAIWYLASAVFILIQVAISLITSLLWHLFLNMTVQVTNKCIFVAVVGWAELSAAILLVVQRFIYFLKWELEGGFSLFLSFFLTQKADKVIKHPCDSSHLDKWWGNIGELEQRSISRNGMKNKTPRVFLLNYWSSF